MQNGLQLMLIIFENLVTLFCPMPLKKFKQMLHFMITRQLQQHSGSYNWSTSLNALAISTFDMGIISPN